MKKIKKWLIRKLGGVVFEDLDIPPIIMQDLMNYWANKAIDKNIAEMLEKGYNPNIPPQPPHSQRVNKGGGINMDEPKCKKCWDKGFSTQYVGATRVLADFIGDKTCEISGPHQEIHYCTCKHGQELKHKADKLN